MAGSLHNRATLLTGGFAELWQATVAELLAAGVKLEFTFRTPEELQTLFLFLRSKNLPAPSQPSIPIKVNDLDKTQLEWTPAAVQRDFGRLEFWVNLYEKAEIIERIAHKAIPLMEKRGYGSILHIIPQNADLEKTIQEITTRTQGKGIHNQVILLPAPMVRPNNIDASGPAPVGEVAKKMIALLTATIPVAAVASKPEPAPA